MLIFRAFLTSRPIGAGFVRNQNVSAPPQDFDPGSPSKSAPFGRAGNPAILDRRQERTEKWRNC
jgi:hypothetical protein